MLYPLKFKPRLKERIWGGDRLSKYGKKVRNGQKIGESWDVSTLDGEISVVAEGVLKGNDLQELIEVYMGELVGDKVYQKFGLNFPLLIKLLDAQDILSIQLHPDDELAEYRHEAYGKGEMCYIVDCDPDSFVYVGFNRKITREEFIEAVINKRVAELLNKIEVKPGDAFYVPAGTLHAYGKGLLIAEIQQASDVTYRVDDWGRKDANGKSRQLHVELAIDAIDFEADQQPVITVEPKVGEVVKMMSCEHFTVNILQVEEAMEREYGEIDSFVIYVCVEGAMEVEYSKGRVKLLKGESLLIPAEENSIIIKGKGRVLETYVE